MLIQSQCRFLIHRPSCWLGFIMGLLLVGCSSSSGPELTGDQVADSPSSSETSPKNELGGKIKFKSGSGQLEFSIKLKDDGAKLVDPEENELARFRLDGSKLKIKDSDDNVLGYVVASPGKYKLKNADQDELWKLQRQDDGDWKLEDGQEQLICRIKKRDYGFEIEDAAYVSRFKAKLKGGKTSLRNNSDETVFSTKDTIPTIAITCLAFETIENNSLKTALMTMLIIDDGGR